MWLRELLITMAQLSSSNNLADIVGLSSTITSETIPPWLIGAVIIALAGALMLLYVRFKHSSTGQLKNIRHQLKVQHITARLAAHDIAKIKLAKPLTEAQLGHLKLLRFAQTEPNNEQVLLFIHQVLR